MISIRINDTLAKDKLYATLFNFWKNNYTFLSDEDIDIFISELKSNLNNLAFSVICDRIIEIFKQRGIFYEWKVINFM